MREISLSKLREVGCNFPFPTYLESGSPLLWNALTGEPLDGEPFRLLGMERIMLPSSAVVKPAKYADISLP